MPYDGIFIHFLVEELQNMLVGGKVNKIAETGSFDLVFHIRAKNALGKIINHQLLISTSLDMPRFYLTKQKLESLDTPRNFCMILRKYLDRSILQEIKQLDNDRVIIFNFNSANELGDAKKYSLIVELMGRNSNIILTNSQNIIIDAIRKLPPSDNVTRIILPKALYQFPNSDHQINPFTLDDNTLPENLQGTFKGAYFTMMENHLSFKAFLQTLRSPYIYQQNNKYDFYLFPLNNVDMVESDFTSISQMLEVFYRKYRRIDTDKAKDLKRHLKSKITHLKTKMANLETDLEAAQDNLKYNDLGLLLQVNLYKVQKGMDKITVEDFTTDNHLVEIPLDPLLDPSINLKKIFIKAKKAKNALIFVNEQLKLTLAEINYLEEILSQIDFASSTDLDEIKDELIDNKYLKAHKKSFSKNKRINLTSFVFNGNEILVGKNNIQNNYLTHKIANSFDWWFHVKDIPGSHVVFRMPYKDYVLTEDDIRYCANLAASYSKAKYSSSVPVDYLEVKYLKKIPGIKGSKVTYTNQKTIYIDPNPES